MKNGSVRAAKVTAPVVRRRDHYLDLNPDDIVLDGWDVPFKADTELPGVLAGNACYNLIGDGPVVRAWIESRAALPVSDAARARIIVMAEPRTNRDDAGQELLYPELDTSHAIIRRLKSRVRG